MRFSHKLFLAATLLAGLTPPVHGQGLAFTATRNAVCTVVNQSGATFTSAGAAAATCSDPGKFVGAANASFDHGVLHASASMQLNNMSFANGYVLCGSLCSSRSDVNGYAVWNESAVVINPLASILRLRFRVDGAVDARLGASTAPCGIVGINTPFSVNSQLFGALPQLHTTTSVACVNGSASAGPVLAAYNQAYVVDVPVVNGMAQFNYTLSAGFLASLWSNSPSGMFSFDGNMDFSHTAGVTGFDVLDANGVDISNRSAVGFLNGLQLMTTVPEPSSFALFGVGALALLGVAGRRKNKTNV